MWARSSALLFAIATVGCSRSDSGEGHPGNGSGDGGGSASATTDGATSGSGGGTGATSGSGEATDATGSSVTGGTSSEPSDGYAEQWCAIVLACDCDEPAYATIEECVDAKQAEIDAARTQAEAIGAVWDQDCADEQLAWHDVTCEAWPGHDQCEGEWCSLFSGATAEGDACTEDDAMLSECAIGFRCHEGQCALYCAHLLHGENCQGIPLGAHCSEGQSCVLQDLGAWCDYERGVGSRCETNGPYCPSPLVCDLEVSGTMSSGVCADPPLRGEPCIDLQCAPDDYCDIDTRICLEPKDEGAPCSRNNECVSNGCDGGSCLAPAELGDDCSIAECVEPLHCDSTTKQCIELDPYLCQAVGG